MLRLRRADPEVTILESRSTPHCRLIVARDPRLVLADVPDLSLSYELQWRGVLMPRGGDLLAGQNHLGGKTLYSWRTRRITAWVSGHARQILRAVSCA